MVDSVSTSEHVHTSRSQALACYPYTVFGQRPATAHNPATIGGVTATLPAQFEAPDYLLRSGYRWGANAPELDPSGPLRAGIYTRLSQDLDGSEEATARQREDGERHAERMGYDVVDYYRDSNRSGYKRKVYREEFERMLRDIRADKLDIIIVWRTDRFSRQMRDVQRFLDLYEETGCQLASVVEAYDIRTASGNYMLWQMANNAQYESALKSERLKRTWAARAKDGRLGPGRRPFGWQDDRLTADPAEAAVIYEAYHRVLRGETVFSIVADWNKRGIETAYGNEWSETTLKQLLTRPRNIGLRTHKTIVRNKANVEITAEGVWQPLIDAETFERVHAILTAPSRNRNRNGYKNSYLLTGFALCGVCLAEGRKVKLVARPSAPGVPAYVCANGPGRQGCGKIRIKADTFEDWIGRLVLAQVDRRSADLKPKRKAAQSAADAFQVVEAKLKRLAEMWARDEMDDVSYSAARDALLDRKAELARVVGDADDQRYQHLPLLETPGALRAAWEAMPTAEKRGYVQAIIARVVVNRGVKGRNYFDKSRIDITWADETADDDLLLLD